MLVALDYTRGAVPLHVQLAGALDDSINAQGLSAGDLLPSETVLAFEYAVSRATVTKAFDMLIERGRITRRQGKRTFVSAAPMQRGLPALTSFTQHVLSLGKVPSNRLLGLRNYAAHAEDKPASPCPDDVSVAGIQRIRTVDGTPVGLQFAIVPTEITELIGLDNQVAAPPDYSCHSALTKHEARSTKHGVRLESGEEALRAVNADASDANLLEVDEGTALIELVRTSKDQFGTLIEVVRARYLGSQYLYRIAFTAPSSGGSHAHDHIQKHAYHTRLGHDLWSGVNLGF